MFSFPCFGKLKINSLVFVFFSKWDFPPFWSSALYSVKHRFEQFYSGLKNSVCVCVCTLSHSVGSNSLQPHGLQPTRLFCQWDFPDKNTRMGCHLPLQAIFLTQGSNTHLLHWQVDSLPLKPWEGPKRTEVHEKTKSSHPNLV